MNFLNNVIWALSISAFILLLISIYLFAHTRQLAKKNKELTHTAALIESAPYYIAYDDIEKSDLYANAAAHRMSGHPTGIPLAKEATHDEKGLRLLFEEAFPCVEKYGTWVGENQLLHSDGHLIDVQQFIFPVRDKDGRRLGMGTLMRDITDEKKMRHNLDMQFALLNSSRSFIIAMDNEFNVIYANPGAYAMSGYTKEEIGFNFIPEVFHDESTCINIRRGWNTAIHEGSAEIESEFIRKNGQRIEVTQKLFVIKDEKGSVMGLGAILDDISELKKTQRDLLEAKEAAEAASRAKSLFVSNMSHEIRTPMNAIIGMTQIAKMSDDTTKIRTSLEKVEASSEHLLNVINDILDISKIESGKLDLYNESFNLEKTIANTIDIIGIKVEEKHLSLAVTIAPDVPRLLYGDANRLSQVVMNLLSNAVKFTDQGGRISLDVRSLPSNMQKARIEIAVSDNGIGMNDEQQSRLFKAFEQADNSITAKYGGTGLGLAISKKLVEMMGGSISVESRPGEGSRFCFNVVFEVVSPEGISSDKAQKQDPGKADFHGKRILIVEDIDINREILVTFLEPTGIEIIEARNGAEAVELFKQNPDRYDLIFMDVQMPIMDGYDATQAIRKCGLARAETVPIIAMTANAFAEDIKKCLEVGMNGHISKPIDMDQVIGRMRDYIGAS